ncbi:hypothetical protein MPH_03279 [Macrophomina phaseolina MS6]|uniref:Uncharacterized protein n=1 Tax=Macrophomina phaseolina (strain MS6) TaxID=1126212 RepID=K2RAB0_MACPH|nr:hypothetical protein MPH_03279 [Macrophomina phaseolina MS6]
MAENNHIPHPTATAGALPSFYHSLDNEELLSKVKNFDDPKEFERLQANLMLPTSRNFFVDFGDDHAWCAFDLSDEAIKALMRKPRPSHLYGRWINVWMPYKQKDVIGTLAKHYDFSPRLYGLMKSDPFPNASKHPDSKHTSSFFERRLRHPLRQQRHQPPSAAPSFTSAIDHDSQPGIEALASADEYFSKMIGHYRLIDEVWHWSTVDEGRKYVSLGYNSLHSTPATRDPLAPLDSSRTDLPVGKRVWSWLVLCEDKTVLNIHEDPFPEKGGYYDVESLQMLFSIRRNLLNVFRNLSKCFDVSRAPAIAVLPIRRRIGNSEEERAHRPSDAPGLLFYNLFDDWYSTYSLVARREHKYAAALDQLRARMMTKAELEHIERLHHIGRQLSVLKRMYQSYEVIIDRVLEKQETTLASLKNSHILSMLEDGGDGGSSYCASSNAPQVGEEVSMLGVSLSSAARARFKRLKYRTRLYAISEIEECLSQKESLNFNLIAIKESLSVERLTRITLLLGKATLLFMPVSIMAAYFSCQFQGVEFTVEQFWTWFGVVVAVSVAAIFGFSVISGTLEGKMMAQSFTRHVLDVGKRWYGRRKSERAGRRDGGGTPPMVGVADAWGGEEEAKIQ